MTTDRDRLRRLAVQYAEQILRGELSPRDGAGRIWALVPESEGDPETHDPLIPFIADADTYDDFPAWSEHPEYRTEAEEGIKRQAQLIVTTWAAWRG